MQLYEQIPSVENPNLDAGIVIKNLAGFYYVQNRDDALYECKIRGKVKNKIVSGDKVIFSKTEDQHGIIEEILPRDNELYRPRVANISLVLIIMAFDNPKPDLNLLDRLLFMAAFNHINPCIVLNKSDLEPDSNVIKIMEYYSLAGFRLITTSVKKNAGIDELKSLIKDEIAVFAGPSGSGKTSLLNAVKPGTGLHTQEVSRKIGRGRHTTRHVELYALESGGWIADTPGFSVLDMPAIKREELPAFFPDFKPYDQDCRFGNCLHYKENDCGIIAAVEKGQILDTRYKDYINMLKEIIDKERCY